MAAAVLFFGLSLFATVRSAEPRWAAPVTASIGTVGTPMVVRLPMPEGFVDPREVGPKVAEYLSGILAPPGRKILAIGLPSAYLTALMQEKAPAVDRYFLVITPVASQNSVKTASEFEEFKALFGQALSPLQKYVPAVQSQLDVMAADASRTTGAQMDLKVGEVRALDDAAQGPQWVRRSLVLAVQWNVDKEAQKSLLVGTQAWVYIKGKYIGFMVYRPYGGVADHQANLELADALMRQVLSLNS